jgi:hypothetical protein
MESGQICRYWAQHPKEAAVLEQTLRDNPNMTLGEVGRRLGLTENQVHAYAYTRNIPHNTHVGRMPGTTHIPMSEKTKIAIRAGYTRWLEAKRLSKQTA